MTAGMDSVRRPLEGITVVEVSMWAFVPSCGALLSDWGADVIKVEPLTGDPIRGLTMGSIGPGTGGFTMMYEIFNRGKRSVAMDLDDSRSRDLLYRMIDDADVFLTSLLPSARRRLGIDIADIQGRNRNVVYAFGHGQGTEGDDADRGGYDSISFWARSGLASAVTPDGTPHPLPMPAGAFGDALSGAVLAGGVAAALADRTRTGYAGVVDASLMGTGMWALQAGITGADLLGVAELPKMQRNALPNPLVNNYRTSDGRFVALCMLQAQRYWPGLCEAIGRNDLVEHDDYNTDEARSRNLAACIAELDGTFATRTLAEWAEALSTQHGQWNIVQTAGEAAHDAGAVTNGFVQHVEYGHNKRLTMVSSPVRFDRQAPPSRPAPELGADTDSVLAKLGLSDGEIIEAKIHGSVL